MFKEVVLEFIGAMLPVIITIIIAITFNKLDKPKKLKEK